MTTIAWDGEYLVADSQSTRDSTPTFGRRKLIKTPYCIAGFSGLECLKDPIEGWLKSTDTPSEIPFSVEETEIIVVTKKELLYYNDQPYPIRYIKKSPIAIGSGWLFATVMMDLGYSAKEAVAYAKKKDTFTGGRSFCLSLKDI